LAKAHFPVDDPDKAFAVTASLRERIRTSSPVAYANGILLLLHGFRAACRSSSISI